MRGELHLMEPAIRRDRTAAEALLDPEFREFGASGRIWGRRSILGMMAANDTPPPAAEGYAATRLAPHVILRTYRTHRPGRTALRSSLWRSRPGEPWRIYFHQGTSVGES